MAALGTWGLTLRAQRDYDSGVTVYSDSDYRGKNTTFRRDIADLRSAGFDNQISSVRVPPGERWEICAGRNYTGKCTVV
ncbi:MAG: beta/gamma crystallin-related protein, partial [Gemmatimonadaceae bacterium]